MSIMGLGPHGERASALTQLNLSCQEAELVRLRRHIVAVVLHTSSSDWARQQIAGIVSTLGDYATAVTEVVDCNFDAVAQSRALERLARQNLSGVISIPVGNMAVSDAHRMVTAGGTKLVLLDNAPAGLLPGTDYVSVVSADNFGLGQSAAEMLSSSIAPGGIVGLLSYGIDFFVTNEREIAFRKWMASNRPDITIRTARFTNVQLVAPVVDGLLTSQPDLAGLFAVWDAPAMQAIAALKARQRSLPITTIDLGNEVAIEMAVGGFIKGVGAQRPYDQGVQAAIALLQSLLGREPPTWIALPGLQVTPQNVVKSYEEVWRCPAPAQLLAAFPSVPTRVRHLTV